MRLDSVGEVPVRRWCLFLCCIGLLSSPTHFFWIMSNSRPVLSDWLFCYGAAVLHSFRKFWRFSSGILHAFQIPHLRRAFTNLIAVLGLFSVARHYKRLALISDITAGIQAFTAACTRESRLSLWQGHRTITYILFYFSLWTRNPFCATSLSGRCMFPVGMAIIGLCSASA
jgi:hypothetical protein